MQSSHRGYPTRGQALLRFAIPQSARGTASSPPAQQLAGTSAWLEVEVPEQATVYLNGTRTRTTGGSRRFHWQQLAPGRVEEVTIRAEITRDRKLIHQTRKVSIRSGDTSHVSFDFGNPETSLTLNVPHDATVSLGGIAKTGDGPVRVFRTTKLGAGQQRRDYLVRVTVKRNGQLLSNERRILLTSGDALSLSFRFEEATVAIAE